MDSQKLIELKEQTEGETKLPIDDKVNPPIIVKSSSVKKRNMIILISSLTIIVAAAIIIPLVIFLNKDEDKKEEVEKIPVIFDVDEGGDDMIAYILANNSKRFNILGITTVSPQYTIDNVTDIWLKFLDFMGFDNKVYKGENHPMIRNSTPANFSHDYQIDFNATNRTIEEKSAVDFMLDTIANYPRKITLFLLAPLTNFALVYQRNNSIINNIEEIIIMGGTKKFGNSGFNRSAEYNIYSDADAANIVFNCGIKVKVIGTDVTHQIEMTEEKYAKYLNVYNTRSSFLVYSVMRGTFLTWNDNYIHDPATVLYYLDNDIIQLKKYYAVVNTTDPNSNESYYGIMSFLEPNETHGYNIEYSETIDLDKYWKLADELVQLY